ncbi:MAG: hypothetical protein IJ736_01185, partial [Firmicutes bacterium]|nr:hypothetical protein [Bacillota bacterium]
LKKPTITDNIFKDQLSVFNPDNLNEEVAPRTFDEMIMALVYMLGIVYDRNFLTVFGHYLKLIRYIYYTPYDFCGEMTFFAESMKDIHDHGDENEERDIPEDCLYSPCSFFEPTALGEKILGLEERIGAMMIIFEKVSADKTLNYILKDDPDAVVDIYLPKPYKTNIYEIKVTDRDDTKMWRTYEIEDDFKLAELHKMIDMTFDMGGSDRYSFFLNEEMDVFNEYTPNAKNKDKDTNNIVAGDVMKNEKDKLYHKVTIPGRTRDAEYVFIIELKKIKKNAVGEYYPIVKKSSKKVIDCMGR